MCVVMAFVLGGFSEEVFSRGWVGFKKRETIHPCDEQAPCCLDLLWLMLQGQLLRGMLSLTKPGQVGSEFNTENSP